MSHQQRVERLKKVVAMLIKRNLTPDDAAFVPAVKSFLIQDGLSLKTIREYTEFLVSCWRATRWEPLIKDNQFLTKEDLENFHKK